MYVNEYWKTCILLAVLTLQNIQLMNNTSYLLYSPSLQIITLPSTTLQGYVKLREECCYSTSLSIYIGHITYKYFLNCVIFPWNQCNSIRMFAVLVKEAKDPGGKDRAW